jgi:predicted transcriptional regulator
MANQLTVQAQDTIRALTKQGWKIRRIAKELGISRNTVRQYVRAMEATPSPTDGSSSAGGSPPTPSQTDPPFDPVVSENSNERRGLKRRELRRRPPGMVREGLILRSPQWDDDFSN